MIKVFLDTSVILAASKSKNGGSSYILMLCRKGNIQGFISRYVVYEAKTSSVTVLDQPEKQRLNFLLLQCRLAVVDEAQEKDIQKYHSIIEKKDVPIIAAAHSQKVDYLLTLNTKDFMQTKVTNYVKPMKIATPKNFITIEKNRQPSNII